MSTVQEESSTPTGYVLASERIAGTILPRSLGTFSLVAILIGIVFFATNASLMSGAGAAGYTFWLLGFLTFLVPGAITTNQLGRMFPGEGSIYVWTTKAMGPFFGFLAGFSAWFPGVIGLVATAVGAIPFVQYLAPTALAATWQQGLVLIGIIAFSGAIACLRFRITRTMTNVVFLCYGAVIAILALAGVLAWVHGHATPVSYTAQSWAPNGGNFTFYGVAILGLLGIEVPLNMGAEITHARAITRYLLWGSALILVLYLLATFGVLSAVPLPQQGNLDAVVVAIQLGIGGGAGQILADLAAVLYIGFFVWVTVVFNYSFARLPFTSGLDSRLPLVVSRVNRFQIPLGRACHSEWDCDWYHRADLSAGTALCASERSRGSVYHGLRCHPGCLNDHLVHLTHVLISHRGHYCAQECVRFRAPTGSSGVGVLPVCCARFTGQPGRDYCHHAKSLDSLARGERVADLDCVSHRALPGYRGSALLPGRAEKRQDTHRRGGDCSGDAALR